MPPWIAYLLPAGGNGAWTPPLRGSVRCCRWDSFAAKSFYGNEGWLSSFLLEPKFPFVTNPSFSVLRSGSAMSTPMPLSPPLSLLLLDPQPCGGAHRHCFLSLLIIDFKTTAATSTMATTAYCPLPMLTCPTDEIGPISLMVTVLS